MTLQVSIRGVDKLKRHLSPAALHASLRKGLQQSGLVVQESAQRTVHSPDNPFIGKAGHSVATGRLQAAIGTSDVKGSGLNQEVRVGTPYGKAGIGTFARSASRTPTGRRPATSRTRTGGRRNKSDVRVYGPIEERRHPFLAPALDTNRSRIRDIIRRALTAGWGL